MPEAHLEKLRLDMMRAGERLLLLMSLEHELNRAKPDADADEFQELLLECRAAVDRFGEDYAIAVGRWRVAIMASVQHRSTRSRHSWRERYSG